MTDPSRAPWQATTADLDALGGFAAELLLRFDASGSLQWANCAAQAQLGVAGERASGRGLTLPELDGPADTSWPAAGGLTTFAGAAGLPPGAGTGPHVSSVATVAASPCWWEWSAWRDDGGTLYLLAHDVSTGRSAAHARCARQRELDAWVEEVGAAVSVRSVDGQLVLGNERHRCWTSASTAPGSPRGEGPLLPPEQRVASGGIVLTTDDEIVTPQGPRTVRTVRFPLRDGAGRVAHVASIAVDITPWVEAGAQLEADRNLLDTLLRVSPDAIVYVGTDRRPVELSQAVFELLGEPAEVSSADLGRRLHPDDAPALTGWLDALLTGRQVGRLRHRVVRSDGRTVHLEASGRLLAGDGGDPSAVLVSRDVSTAVEVEEQLDHALSVARAAGRAKEELLGRISGELRVPLEDLLATADRLHRGASEAGIMVPAQQDAVQHIDRAAHHLRSLIDEIADVSSLQRRGTALQLAAVPVGRLVADAVGLVRPLGEGSGVQVTGPPDGGAGPWVRADRQRLLQVLLNLLSNGVKYNRPGGTVRVSVSVFGSRIRVAVSDTGVGIAPEHLDRLFDPFDRLGAEHSAVEGTGVGLTVTRHLVEQMGGTVEVASAVGTGTVFAVELAAAEPPPSGARTDVARPAVRMLRVLHVEDDPASGELVHQLLQRRPGIDLVRAADGATALVLARDDPPDLLLLDLGLPDVDGKAVLDRLRDDPLTAAVPVVVISADATDGQVQRLLSAGAAAYLTKPVAVGQLLALVDAAAESVAADGTAGARVGGTAGSTDGREPTGSAPPS